MKAEHRKELKTNVVAESLSRALEGLKQGPSRVGWILLGLGVVFVIVFFTWRYFSRSAEESDSERWARWDGLSTPAQLRQFAEDKDVEGKTPGRLARFQEARRELLNGLEELGYGAKGAREHIQQAAASYEALANESDNLPILRQEALMGAAKAHESLGNTKRASELYQQLVSGHPGSTFAADAQTQLDRLKDESRTKDLQKLDAELSASEKSPRPTP